MTRRENFKRVYEVIQSDKSVLSEECKALIERDLQEKLEEYFEVSSPAKLEVVCQKGKYRVSLTFEAERVKKFNVLK